MRALPPRCPPLAARCAKGTSSSPTTPRTTTASQSTRTWRGSCARTCSASALSSRLATRADLDESVQDLVDDDRPHDEDDQRDDALDPDHPGALGRAVVAGRGPDRPRGRGVGDLLQARLLGARHALLERLEVADRGPVRLDRAVALGERGVALGDGALALEVGRGALVERLVARVERGRALLHGPVALLDDG